MPRIFTPEFEADGDAFDEDDEADPFLASPDAFQYLSPPAFGGPQGPVKVPVRPGAPKPAAKPLSFLDKMLGRKAPAPDPWDAKLEAVAADLASRMAALGAVKACIRYDGGNDEGFAWFSHCIFADGSIRDVDRIAQDLTTTGAIQALRPLERDFDIRETLDDLLAPQWAVQLLGGHFGTGGYVMYGAFTVDLRTGLVEDQRDPEPVVQNIEFKAD
jgi:hypothetical protein